MIMECSLLSDYSRYQVLDFPGGSLLRIEPVRKKPDLSEVECRAENGAGDAVYAQATLTVYDGKWRFWLIFGHLRADPYLLP